MSKSPNTKPTVLLIADTLAQYNDWQKWLHMIDFNCNLIYVSNLELALLEIKQNKIDIYIIDLEKVNGNIISFLGLIKNKKALKITLTKSVDNITFLDKLYELGSIPVAKSNNLSEPYRIAELIVYIYQTTIVSVNDHQCIQGSSITMLSEDLGKLQTMVYLLKEDNVRTVEDLKELKRYIIGTFEQTGLVTKVEMLLDDLDLIKNKSDNLGMNLLDLYKSSPMYLKLLILICLGIVISTAPLWLWLMYKILGG